jgi:predicted nuclease of predicted toxin-antitoxin system
LSLALYLDEHVPLAVAQGLRLRGVDVLTVQDDDRKGIVDYLLLDRATELGRALFSQDEDLLAEAKRRQVEGIPFSGVIYAHQLRVTIGTCVMDLHVMAEIMDSQDLANRVEFLPL